MRSCHIVIAKETVRQLQIASGLWVPRRLRPPKIQQPRARRACLGERVQIDGCEHRWFEDRAPACTALVYVDDATSRVRAFVRLRDLLSSNKALAHQFAQLEARLNRRLDDHDAAIADILTAIRQLMAPAATKRRGIGFTAKL